MNIQIKPQENSDDETVARLLEKDPGHFEPTTAFRIAQHLAGEAGLDVGPHTGIQPAPLAVSGFRRKLQGTVVKSAFAPLVGPLGALPPEYNELLLREERRRSRALISFLNLFAIRFSELFVAACEKYRLARRLRWTANRKDNTFRKVLLSLTGFGTAGLVERAGIDEDVILRFSGFFADRTRNATNLRAMLEEYCGLPVEIEQFRPRWVSIPPEDRSRMGKAAGGGGGLGSGPRLGVNAMAGAAVLDRSGALRIVIGPVGYDDYISLSPGTARLAEIFALTRLFIGNGFDIDAQVVLKKEDIPFCQMGSATMPARLGWNSWARLGEALVDSRDAIVSEHQAMPAALQAGGRP
ncbi:type VI secretion system baseplate subunit TssG [Allorhizobium taibaishanense]|uniref:Type VI secretion protein n=1 Tax=Allorhizobium taibaishanense TaxID=887144 RepID=A0A1Q9A9X0_9HYPH|nr:type VI secretion system baseplate subunit TssG [Allorhizobium taibaishanense]MBB4010026.1 type VI secretion system protein ImpH [Allorhizobium taibaishanense]OLP51637.1 type VI secretion protein [Allorhizobium taibaishanense]